MVCRCKLCAALYLPAEPAGNVRRKGWLVISNLQFGRQMVSRISAAAQLHAGNFVSASRTPARRSQATAPIPTMDNIETKTGLPNSILNNHYTLVVLMRYNCSSFSFAHIGAEEFRGPLYLLCECPNPLFLRLARFCFAVRRSTP